MVIPFSIIVQHHGSYNAATAACLASRILLIIINVGIHLLVRVNQQRKVFSTLIAVTYIAVGD